MRGADRQQSSTFSYISAERRVPKDHPPRAVRVMVDAALKESSWRFDAVYASSGRPSVAPEKLSRAALAGAVHGAQRATFDGAARLQFSVSLVGLNIDDPVWDVTVFTKNRCDAATAAYNLVRIRNLTLAAP